ncbi:MAG TPA: hypothetical protein VHV83_14715, partial [Armatimonadota bacterium]|nr:hypothetical protein [Armatimonadota bacterium]
RGDIGPCVTAYTNTLGGRVVTMGYVPWRQLGSTAKRQQVLTLADWAAKGRLPVRIDGAPRTAVLVRSNADGTKFAAVLLNTSYDETGPVTLRFRMDAPTVRVLGGRDSIQLETTHIEGETRCTLSNIPSWNTIMLVGE